MPNAAWIRPQQRTRTDRGAYPSQGADTQPMVIKGTARETPQGTPANAMPGGGVFQPGAPHPGVVAGPYAQGYPQQYATVHPASPPPAGPPPAGPPPTGGGRGRRTRRLPRNWRTPIGQPQQRPWWLLRYGLAGLLGAVGALRGQLWLVVAAAGYLAAMGTYRRWLRPVLAGQHPARAPFARAFATFTVAVVLCCGGLFSSQPWRVGAQPALADAAGSLGSFGVQMVKGFMSKSDDPAGDSGAGQPAEITACKPTKKHPCDDATGAAGGEASADADQP